jgi:hypothetical protein
MMEGTDRWPPGREDERDEAPGGAVGSWLDLVGRATSEVIHTISAFGQNNVLRQYHRLDESDNEDRDRSDEWGDPP